MSHAINVSNSRSNNFELLIALDDRNSASGKLFWDDGESVDTIENGLYQINTFELSEVIIELIHESGDVKVENIDLIWLCCRRMY